MTGSVERYQVGQLPSGTPISAIELSNEYLRMTVLDLGASLWTLVPRDDPSAVGLTLSHRDASAYATNPPYLGCTVGPVANRVGGSVFSLGGRRHRLVPNEGAHHLHGGPTGFGHRIWDVEVDSDAMAAVFRRHRPDGEGGYPGDLDVEVTWRLRGNRVHFSWSARADLPTPVSLTNHTYWNLAGGGTIRDHRLSVHADAVVVVDEQLIPTGVLSPVHGTAFDLVAGERIGDVVGELALGGIDHCYALVPGGRVTLEDPGSGRGLVVETSLPGVQVYTGHQLDGSVAHGGFGPMAGVCLETQFFPDAINNAQFPSPVVDPHATVVHWTEYTVLGVGSVDQPAHRRR